MRMCERERAGEKGAHVAPSCPVATFVERDTGDPCAEGAFAIIAIERRKAGDERLLRQSHRLVGISDLLYDEPVDARFVTRSEEHTSELQSLMRNSYDVFCLNKKTNVQTIYTLPDISAL